jgi:3-hydroxyacyl-[acyl-carrier-protein] dehydratase
MLMNDLYSIHDMQQGDNTLSGTIRFNQQHQIFDGHFPGQPVVPGVCMIQIVKELLQQHISKPLQLSSTGQVKFLQLITPDVSPEFTLNWKEGDEEYIVTSVFRKEADQFKFSGIFQSK